MYHLECYKANALDLLTFGVTHSILIYVFTFMCLHSPLNENE